MNAPATGTLRYKVAAVTRAMSVREPAMAAASRTHGPMGSVTTGSWKNNRKDGSGNMRLPDGDSYDGDWRDDRATGKGDIPFCQRRLIHRRGARWRGAWSGHHAPFW